MSNESQRPTSRRQRPRRGTRRGPDARRRDSNRGATASTTGTERFVAGENGRVPARATDASARPATGTQGGAGVNAADSTVAPAGESRGLRGKLSSWWALWGPHIRRFAPTILVSHAVTLAVAIALAVLIGIGETFTAVPAMVGSFWMVANLAPVGFTGVQLGIVPLLPAALIVLVHSRRIRRTCGTQITVRNIRVFGVLAVVVPMVLTVLAWLALWDASHVFAVTPPNLAVALLSTALLNGFVFVLGLGPKIWRALLLRRGLPTWPVEAARLAGSFVRWMLAAGLVAALVQLLLNMSVLADAYSIAPDAWGKLGLSVLSVLYLPNLAVGASGILMGSEMHVGDASASLFAVTNANLPPLPVLAAVPHSGLPFGELLLVVPALIALVIVYRFFAARTFVESPVFTALGAGVASGVLGLLLSLASGGTLGVYGSAGPLVWLTPLVFACWIVVPALVVFAWVSRRGARVTETVEGDAADAMRGTGEEDRDEFPDPETQDEDGEAAQDAGSTAETEEPDAQDDTDAGVGSTEPEDAGGAGDSGEDVDNAVAGEAEEAGETEAVTGGGDQAAPTESEDTDVEDEDTTQ
nr:DUF6350 family protein [Corynebacterium sp.]